MCISFSGDELSSIIEAGLEMKNPDIFAESYSFSMLFDPNAPKDSQFVLNCVLKAPKETVAELPPINSNA